MNSNQQQTTGASTSSFGTYTTQYQQRRPIYGNYSNTTTSTVARDNFGGYNQTMGTLTQNGLRVLDGLLNNTT